MREEKDGGRAGDRAGERNEEETTGKRTRLSTYVVMLARTFSWFHFAGGLAVLSTPVHYLSIKSQSH